MIGNTSDSEACFGGGDLLAMVVAQEESQVQIRIRVVPVAHASQRYPSVMLQSSAQLIMKGSPGGRTSSEVL